MQKEETKINLTNYVVIVTSSEIGHFGKILSERYSEK